MNANRPKLLSGGHRGAEAAFGRAAARWQIEQTTFSFEGHTMEWPMSVRVLTPEELLEGDVSMAIVSRRLGRTYFQPDKIRKVIQSIYHMVVEAYQVFVIGQILPDDTVKGGTGWAVELAKFFTRPVWVFDQERGAWFHWRGGRWEPEAAVIAPRPFCGTGTRHLNEAGAQAIEELFRRSFGPPPSEA
jgi:hypothetical protein